MEWQGQGFTKPDRYSKHVPGHLGQHWPGPLWGLAQVVGGQLTKEHVTVPSWEQVRRQWGWAPGGAQQGSSKPGEVPRSGRCGKGCLHL